MSCIVVIDKWNFNVEKERPEQKKINIRKEKRTQKNRKGGTGEEIENNCDEGTPDTQVKVWHKTHCLFKLYSIIKL